MDIKRRVLISFRVCVFRILKKLKVVNFIHATRTRNVYIYI